MAYPPDLHALGFDFEELDGLLNAIGGSPSAQVARDKHYQQIYHYSDRNGAGVTLFLYENEISDIVPSLSGPQFVSATLYEVYPGLACVDIFQDDPKNPDFRLLVAVDDPHRYHIQPYGSSCTHKKVKRFHISGVAIDVTVFPTEEIWKQSQTPIRVPRSRVEATAATADNAENSANTKNSADITSQNSVDITSQNSADDTSEMTDIHIGPEFVTSPWLFSLAQGKCIPEQASSLSMFKGIVSSAELMTNPLTGSLWWKCEVSCGFPLVVGVPYDQAPQILPGSVIDGKVLLLGTSGTWNK